MFRKEGKMKFDKMPVAEVREGDTKPMKDAILALDALGVDVRRPKGSPHQIKVMPTLSYYPTTGLVLDDGSNGAREERGIESLIGLLRREGLIAKSR